MIILCAGHTGRSRMARSREPWTTPRQWGLHAERRRNRLYSAKHSDARGYGRVPNDRRPRHDRSDL
jgi:hypothetical protein